MSHHFCLGLAPIIGNLKYVSWVGAGLNLKAARSPLLGRKRQTRSSRLNRTKYSTF